MSPHPDEVASHEVSAVQEFMDAARSLLSDLRAERKLRRQHQQTEPANSHQGAVMRSAWFQDAASDVLRRIRTVQNLTQSVTDWNLCAEERIRLHSDEQHQINLEALIQEKVQSRLAESQAEWQREKHSLTTELAQIKSVLWQQTVATDTSRSPSVAGPDQLVDIEAWSSALERIEGTRAAGYAKQLLVCWRSKMKLDEMMSPRSHAEQVSHGNT